MHVLEAACDSEFTMENGLLISQPGAKTDCHMHAGPVIAKLIGVGLQRRNAATGQVEAVVQQPCEGIAFPIVKHYMLFDPTTLEKAGITVFDTRETMQLHVLLNKIRLCSADQQRQIRWFYGCVDGTTVNTVVWPSTMWHWVLTLSTDSDERRLWIGLATQFIPRGVENRAMLDATLQRSAATDATGRPVSELDHLRLQTSSVHLTQTVRQMVEQPGPDAIRMATWHQHLVLEAAAAQVQTADSQTAIGEHEKAWNTLEVALSSLRAAFPMGHKLSVVAAKAQMRLSHVIQRAGEAERTVRSTTHGSRHAGKP
jgi:hypothetical protein